MPRQDAGASSEFRIFETDEFLKRFKRFPRKESHFLQRKLHEYIYPQLRKNPFLGPNIRKIKYGAAPTGTPLRYTPDTWRYRIGDFRVFYLVDQPKRTVFVLSIDDRRDAYR